MKQKKHFFILAILLINSYGVTAAAEVSSSNTSNPETAETTGYSAVSEKSDTDSTEKMSSSDLEETISSSETPAMQAKQQDPASQNAEVFDATKLYSYPLGVGTEFTAFAGGTLTIGHQDTTGFMGADTINSVNSWPNLFTPNLTGGLAVSDPQEDISLVANKINDNLASVLSRQNMFMNQKIITTNEKIPEAKKSSHKADDLQSFKDNGIHSENWQNTTKSNLLAVSSQYQALTGNKDVAVSDTSIQASQQTNFDGSTNKQVHQLSIDLSQYQGTQTPIIVFNLQMLQNNDTFEINFKKGNSDVLPYIIINWQNTGDFTWGWNNTFIVKGDTGTEAIGNRIINSFSKATNISIIASKFYGSILAPQGSIIVGESGVDLMHSNYIAGDNIEMKSQLPLAQAADNHFDHSSWPGAKPPYEESEQSPTIALTQDGKVVTGPIHIVTGQKIILGVQTTNYEGETIQEGIDDGKLVDISLGDAIELENLPVGKHTLTVQLPDQPEVKQQVSIIVSGYLTLDEIPNLQFGSKDLKQYTITPNYQLVDGNVSSSSGSEGNDQLSVKVTDNRYVEEQSPWSLSVQLSNFNNDRTSLPGSITFSSGIGSDGLLNGKVISGQTLTFTKDEKTSITGSLKEQLSTATSLNLSEQSPEPGTYQGKLSWTLNNAPQ